MNISLRTEYSVRALVYMAKKDLNKTTTISEICKEKNLPQKFIEQLFNKLRRKKIIKSIRGKYGGYRLNLLPEEITLKAIIEAVDDTFFDLFCSSSPKYCEAPNCDTQSLWIHLMDDMSVYFSKITLKNIIEEKGIPYDKKLFQ